MLAKEMPASDTQVDAEIKKLQDTVVGLQSEHEKFQQRLVKASEERRRLQKNINETKKVHAQAVKDLLDGEILQDDLSPEGMLEKVYKANIGTGRASGQVLANVEKLEGTETYCRERQRDISKEISGLKKQIHALKMTSILQEAYQKYNAWMTTYFEVERLWHNFKDAVSSVHAQGPMNHKIELEKADIADPIFFDLLASRMRSGVLKRLTMWELVNGLSGIAQIRPNPWYTEKSRYDERRIGDRRLYDPRRDNFKP